MICPNCGNDHIQINEAWDKTIDIPTRYKVIYWVVVVFLGIFSLALFKVNNNAGSWLLIITIILAVGARSAYYGWRKNQRKKSHS